jgi:DNA polymerase-1
MLKIPTSSIPRLDNQQKAWAYNALDVCVTAEVHEALREKVAASENAKAIYAFERGMQKCALTMQLRGVRVDEVARQKLIRELKAEAKGLQKDCDTFYKAVYAEKKIQYQAALSANKHAYAETEKQKPKDRDTVQRRELRKQKTVLEKAIKACNGFVYKKALEPSSAQIQKVFYEEMGIPKHKNRLGKVSMDKDVLKRIAKKYKKAKPLCDLVSLLRDSQKQIEVLTSALSPDGRMRASWNVGATEMGRWSSSSDPYGDGTNLQNQDRRVRHIYIPDPGMEMVNADLEQADSRGVAYLAGDENYIAAHEDGNVHVAAGYIFWPDALDWTGDLEKDAKLMKLTPAPWVKQPEVEEGQKPAFNYYDMSKKGQHGLNYAMQPPALARQLGCSVKEAERYWDNYFTRYPGIPEWQRRVIQEVKDTSRLVSPLGRERQFFGRPWDASTHREAIAFIPASITTDVLKIGMLKVYMELDRGSGKFELLMDGHDAILGQMALRDDETAKRVEELMRVEVPILGRTMVIPVSVERGPNWRDCG